LFVPFHTTSSKDQVAIIIPRICLFVKGVENLYAEATLAITSGNSSTSFDYAAERKSGSSCGS
jgi:hypothetical protein